MELQVGVKILLKNKEGKFLFVRRNPKKYPDMRSSWDIVGGRIEPGMPLIENLKREIKEETGLDYTGKPQLVAAQDILKNNSRHVVRLTYTGEIEGEPVLSDEHLEGGWFTSQQIKNIPLSDLDSFFRELLDKKIIILY
jgi:ADP-ribose pyrophosphatase YjhB (NUDIX family)